MDGKGRLILEATVTSVGEGPYYYPACRQCYSMLTGQTDNFCPKCKKIYTNAEVNQRYRLCLTVSDGLSLTNVTAFGNIITPFFGCSASEFHSIRNGQFSPWMTSALLKAALEKSMIGSSLLFGFKGNVQKPQGGRVTLRDVENLDHNSTASHSSWKRDLIAFQILPQCEFQYPVPVIQHLQKLDDFINQKENFDIANINHYDVSNLWTDIGNKNRNNSVSNQSLHGKSIFFHGCENEDNSGFDSDSSKFVLSSAESEASIEFSISRSTQNSEAECSSLLKEDSIRSTFLFRDSNNKSFEYNSVKHLDKSVNDFISVPRVKSSWCVKKWLRQKKYSGLNESLLGNKKHTTHSTVFYDSLYPSPEKSREKISNVSSSTNVFSNFSTVDIVPSPCDCDKAHFKSSQNLISASENSNRNQSNQHFIAGNQRSLLTLKSYKYKKDVKSSELDKANNKSPSSSPMENTVNARWEENRRNSHNSTCGFGKKSHRRNSKVKRPSLSLLQLPESEDFDLFIEAAGSGPMPRDLNQNVRCMPRRESRIPQNLSGYDDKCRSSGSRIRLYSSRLEKSINSCPKSFTDMPESEDFDLFLDAAGSDQMPRRSNSDSDIPDTPQGRGNNVHNPSNNKGLKSFTDMPESEDFDLFLDATRSDQLPQRRNSRHKSSNNKCMTKCPKSFTDIPESEDFDLFIQAVGSGQFPETLNSTPAKTSQRGKRLSQNSFRKKRRSNNNRFKSSSDKNVTNCHKSFFIDLPESEDYDLFLDVVNLENLQLEPENSDVKTKVSEDLDMIREDPSVQNKIYHKASRQLVSDNIFSSASPSSIELSKKGNGRINSSQILNNADISGSSDHFNSSCDLFESPIQSQRPFHKMSMRSNEDVFYDNEGIDESHSANQNYSCSLFSTPLPSSSRRLTIPQSQNFVDVDILKRKSHCDDDTFMDLFSPGLKSKSKSPCRQRQPSNNHGDCFNSSSSSFSFNSHSQDLFASQDGED